MTQSEIVSLASTLLGAISVIGGGIAYYRSSVIKRYAAQRDFEHLKRNYESISAAIATSHQETEQLLRDMDRQISEMKALVHLLATKKD
jgi:hypothetical protein